MHPRFLPASLALLLCTACAIQGPDVPSGSSAQSSVASSIASVAASSVSSDSASPLIFGATGVLAGADTIRVPFSHRTDTGDIDLRVLANDGIRTITQFNENLADGSVAWPYLTSPESLLYIAGIGKAGYGVYDLEGNDRTAEHAVLKDKKFSVTGYYRIDEKQYAYGLHAADVMTEAGDTDVGNRAGIFIHRDGEEKESHFPISRVGLGELTGLQPLCLSADGEWLYVRYQGWEGFEYMSAWKLRISDLHYESVFAKNDKIVSYHCSDRRDMIVGVRAEVNENFGWGGAAWMPMSLVLFNGADGTEKSLLDVNDALIESAVMTPDAKHIVYRLVYPAKDEKGEYMDPYGGEPGATWEIFMMSIDGTNNRSVGNFESVDGMSRDGKVLVVGKSVNTPYADSKQYFLLNTDTGGVAALSNDGYSKVISCNYGQGFDCLY